MTTTRKASGRAASFPGGLAAGLATSAGITLMSAAVLAWLLEKEIMKEEVIGYGSLATLILSSFVGAMVCSALIKRRRALACILSGCSYYLFLLACTALLFGGIYTGMGVTALSIFGTSLSVALLTRGGRRGGYKRRKRVTR